jgi:arginyl-tRNA synthetase
MKEELIKILNSVLLELADDKGIDLSGKKITLQENKDKSHGDYASNLAMSLSKELEDSPKNIANLIISKFPEEPWIKNIDVAGPGFINFFLDSKIRSEVLITIDEQGHRYGTNNEGNNKKVLIEYVSSNPTGPLHVGHGRGAVFGSVLAKLLSSNGYAVDEEYYVNDAGRQIKILATSLWIRYAQLFNKEINMTKNGYQGEYLIPIAKRLKEAHSDKFYSPKEVISQLIDLEGKEDGAYADQIAAAVIGFLGEDFFFFEEFARKEILEMIVDDLQDFGVIHNNWFSENSLYVEDESGLSKVDKAIQELGCLGFIYEKEGATWFKSSEFGDDKDRVLKRSNGEATYFTSDIAYHMDKYDRGYDRIINIWGSDHHGYTPRVNAAMKASGRDTKKLEVVYIQFANLLRDGEKVSMSTRGGEFITLKELMDEVTPEAARFFYINRKADQHLDFDLELAKSQTKDNPLYYIQYAHARICSVFETLERNKKEFNLTTAKENLNLLSTDKEAEIKKMLILFPEIIQRAAKSSEPHLICYYLKDLAGLFHSYYNSEKFLVEDTSLMNARLFLLKGVKQVTANGLNILGIKAPTLM